MKEGLLAALCILPLAAQPISVAIKDVPSAEIIRYLADETGRNLVLAENLDSKIHLRLENRSFDEILNAMGKINGLSVKQEKGIYYVVKQPIKSPEPMANAAPTATAKNLARSTPTTPARAQISGTVAKEPAKPKIISRTIKLHYAKASEVVESLTKGQGSFLSENGYLHFDDRSNSLIIKDSQAALNNALKLIKELDKPTEQIAIEARIVTIASEQLQELGVRWGAFRPDGNHHRFAGSLEANGLPSSNRLNVNFPVGSGASAALQVASLNSRVLDLELSALEQENSVEIIASPRLMTTNKKSASIKQGTEIPYILYNPKSEMRDIEFKEAVLGLEVTPHISKNNQILMDLVVTQNSPNNAIGSNALTTIDKQELNTQVFAKHGETIVLGGIFQHLVSKGEDRVPILGSIPVIKRLFSQNRDKISKRELVVFVTPYVVPSEPAHSAEQAPTKSTKKRKNNSK